MGHVRRGFRSFRARVIIALAVCGAIAALLVVVSAAAALPSCTDTYNSADSGGDWSTAANWSTGVVPTSSTIACWGAGVTVAVTTGASADSIQGGALSINGGTLDLTNSSDDSTVGNVTLAASSTLEGPSPLTINGSFAWTGSGQLDAAITQSDGSGTCFTLSGTGQAYLTGGSVQTSCQVTIDNPGTINTGGATVTTTSTIDFGSGVVVGQGGATFTATGVIGPGSGTYGFTGDALVLTSGSTTVAAGETLESGPLTVQNGQTITIASTGGLEQTGGTGQVESGGSVKGAGSLDVAGGSLDVDSGGSLTSGFSVTGGTLTADVGSTTGSSSSTVSVTSGTLAVNGAATTGNVTFSGGAITGSAQLSVDGSFDWTAQAQLDADIVQTDGSGTCFTISGTGQAYLTGGSVQTSCQVTITNPGFINTGGATVTTTSTIDFGSGVVVGQSGSTFTAAGVIGPGSGTYGFADDVLVLTSGATTVTSGETLESASLIVKSGQTTTIDSGGTVEQLGGGAGQIESGAVVTGAGSFDVAGGTLDVDSGGSLTSGMSVTGGTLTADVGSTTGSSSSPVSVTSGTLAVNGAATTGNVTLSGGLISGAGQLSVDGTFDWTAQAQLDADIVQTDGSGTCFTISGTGQAYLTGGSVQTSCQVTISNPGFITAGNATVTTTSTLDFADGLDIPVNGGDNATFTAAGIAANAGPTYGTGGDSLVLTGGSTTVAHGNTLDSGPLTIQGGTLQDDGTVNGATTLTGGTLDGTGTLGGSVTNTSGTVEAGVAGVGTLAVSGSYTQASGGTLTVPISGANSGDYPVLAVSGMVTLNGTVALQPTNAYANSAQQGDVISFMSFTSNDNSTTPAPTTVPALHDGEQFTLEPTVGDFWNAVVGTPAQPTEASAPVVTGTAQQGDQLATTNGTWNNVSNDGATYTYAWEDCPTATPPTGCTTISGAHSSTYSLTSNDVGKYVTAIVTAQNASESTGSATGAPVKGPVLPAAPTNTTGPTITGTPAVGATLTCNPGTWTGSPTFSYVWQLNGDAIPGATSSTYTVPSGAAGGQLTCVVKGTNDGGSSTATSAAVAVPTPVTPPPAPAAPATVTGPSVTGTPLPGDTLTCDPGTWTGNPTFTYQWNVDSNPVTGETENTYTVTVLDEGQTITCTVAASNSTATVKSTSSVGVVVAQKGTLTCPKPSGTLTGRRIGPLALGETRTAARHALKQYAVTHNGFDNFCLYGGWGIRGAYKSNKFVLLLTANPYYKLASVSVGLEITSVAKRLKLGKAIPIGLNDWYVAPGASSNYIFKVRHGIIQEIGIANKHDTATRAQQKRFLASFKAA